MKATRSMLVAGMSVAAMAGMAAPAFAAPAAPAAPGKQPVTAQQCTASKGKVQRAHDGVGTCVGGTYDDLLPVHEMTLKRESYARVPPHLHVMFPHNLAAYTIQHRFGSAGRARRW